MYNDLFLTLNNMQSYEMLYNDISKDTLVFLSEDKQLIILGNITFQFLPEFTGTGEILGVKDNKLAWIDEPIFPDVDISIYETKLNAAAKYQPKGDYLIEHQDLSEYVKASNIDSLIEKSFKDVKEELDELEIIPKIKAISETDFQALGVENMVTNVQYNIYGKQIELGEIYVHNKVTKQNSFVSIDVLKTLDTEEYEPIGIVVIPSSHNVYGNGMPGVISLKYARYDKPDEGGDAQTIAWGQNKKIFGLTPWKGSNKLQYTPNIGYASINPTTPAKVFISDKFSTVQNPFDTKRGWFSKDGGHIVSPFLEDDSKNNQFLMYKLSEVDGKENTRKLKECRSKYEEFGEFEILDALDKVEDKELYIPTIAELGYLCANQKFIQEKLNQYPEIKLHLNISPNIISSSNGGDNSLYYLNLINGNVGTVVTYSAGIVLLFKKVFGNGKVGQFYSNGEFVDEYNSNCEGIVVTPYTHNVYGDNSCSILILKYLTKEGLSDTYSLLTYFKYDTTAYKNGCIDYENFNKGNVYCVDLMSNINFNELTTPDTATNYIPSDTFEGQLCSDKTSLYKYSTGPYSPSAYNEDGSKNQLFFSGDLLDFNGYENTKNILDNFTLDNEWKTSAIIKNYSTDLPKDNPWKVEQMPEGSFPAFFCCWRYKTLGTNHGDWYLPGIGELCYIELRLSKINNLIEELNNLYSNKFYSINGGEHSSTTENGINAMGSLVIDTGRCYGSDAKSYPSLVRPFLNVMLAEQFKEVNPSYEIVDENPDDWAQGEEHNLKIKRLAPPSFDFEIKIDININGGESSEDAFIDDGQSNFEKDITVIPNSDNIDISFTIDGKDVSDGFNKEEIEEAEPEYQEVDMGKAGIWAACNIGASKPEEYGLYFQWGDTKGYINICPLSETNISEDKHYFYWGDYKFGGNDSVDQSKYNSTDNLKNLELEDDAAYVNMGKSWRVPTPYEFNKLYTLCNTEWTDNYEGTGTPGRIFKLKTDESKRLFFPAAGHCASGTLYYTDGGGAFGSYWASSLYGSSNHIGCDLYFNSNNVTPQGSRYRYFGYSIRAIKYKQPETNGHEYVDFGLPSGTLWATCNLGATNPYDGGLCFSWGDTNGYTSTFDKLGGFNWTNTPYYVSGDEWYNVKFSKYITSNTWGNIDNKTVLDLEDDAANNMLGGEWQIPTPEDFKELNENCNSTWTTINDMYGITLTSKKDSSISIFLPAIKPLMNNNGNTETNSSGRYWTNTLDTNDNCTAQEIRFSWDAPDIYVGLNTYRNIGNPIRPCIKK